MLDNGDALLAGLIVMEPLNKQKQRNFDRFMAAAGDLRVGRKLYTKMQLLSIKEILKGKRFETPDVLGKKTTAQRQLDL